MPIYALLITGEPVVVFAAADYPNALSFAADKFIRSELSYLSHPGGQPLLEHGVQMTVREALTHEQAIWETDVQMGIREGEVASRDEALSDQWFAFLIPYQDPV